MLRRGTTTCSTKNVLQMALRDCDDPLRKGMLFVPVPGQQPHYVPLWRLADREVTTDLSN